MLCILKIIVQRISCMRSSPCFPLASCRLCKNPASHNLRNLLWNLRNSPCSFLPKSSTKRRHYETVLSTPGASQQGDSRKYNRFQILIPDTMQQSHITFLLSPGPYLSLSQYFMQFCSYKLEELFDTLDRH